jgi:hypothetical protein
MKQSEKAIPFHLNFKTSIISKSKRSFAKLSILSFHFVSKNLETVEMKTWKVALFCGLPFGAFMMIVNSFISGSVINGGVAGLISGILFGLSFSFFIKRFTNRNLKRIHIPLNFDEKLIKEAGANHFKGAEGVGGKLALTASRLIFKSHHFNIQNHLEVISLREIKSMGAGKSLGFLRNVLALELFDQSKHRFIVDDPDSWISSIKAQSS